MNRESSRSHAVFTVCIKTLKKNGEITNAKESKLNMIDLAGSERQRDTKVPFPISSLLGLHLSVNLIYHHKIIVTLTRSSRIALSPFHPPPPFL